MANSYLSDVSTSLSRINNLNGIKYTHSTRDVRSNKTELNNKKGKNIFCNIWHVICKPHNEDILPSVDLRRHENQGDSGGGVFRLKFFLNRIGSSKLYVAFSQILSYNYQPTTTSISNYRLDQKYTKIQPQERTFNHIYYKYPRKVEKRPSNNSRIKLNESLVNIQISSALQSHLNHYRRPLFPSTPTIAASAKETSKYFTDSLINQGTITSERSNRYQNPKNNNAVLLDILPTGYDRTMAWSTTIRHRERAFLLLDLGGIIRSYAHFVSLCGLLSSVKLCIQPQFCVTKNPNVELLRLLIRLGVDLRCSSVHDILAVGEAFGNLEIFGYNKAVITESTDSFTKKNHLSFHKSSDSTSPSLLKKINNIVKEDSLKIYTNEMVVRKSFHGRLVDDASRTRKPNSYLRRLSQAKKIYSSMNKEKNKEGCESHIYHVDNILHLSVDGPDEVIRISNAISSFNDNNLYNNQVKKLKRENGYIIRMPAISTEKKNSCDDYINMKRIWGDLVLSTYAATIKTGDLLVGVSVDLSPWSVIFASSYYSSPNIRTYKVGKLSSILINVCVRLRLFRLLMLSLGQTRVRVDLTGLPLPFNRICVEYLTHALDTFVSSDIMMEELLEVLMGSNFDKVNCDNVTPERLRLLLKTTNLRPAAQPVGVYYTADVSEYLVSNSGALCTRIIGKKIMQKDTLKVEGRTKNTVIGLHRQVRNLERDSLVHYYIDDGCYGSLGSPLRSDTHSKIKLSQGSKINSHLEKQNNLNIPIPLYGDFGKISNFRSRPIYTYTRKNKTIPPKNVLINVHFPSSTKNLISNCHDAKFSSLGEIGSQLTSSCSVTKATVWGPTCDGLDKVCDSLPLPGDLEPNRDWLVFPHLGCGVFGGGFGLCTAFNGLHPPDTAYCVFNYFSRDFSGKKMT